MTPFVAADGSATRSRDEQIKRQTTPGKYAKLNGAMKNRLSLFVAMSAMAWLAPLGCSNNNIDTAQVRAAFQSVSGDTREHLEEGLKAIDQSNYVAAVRPLKWIAYKVKLDKNQTAVLKDTIAKAEAKAAKQK